jgi:sialate O-acetylesterase
MRRATLSSIIAISLLLFVQAIYAEVKLPAIVSSGMVLQRNTTVVLWGWADPYEKITIETSWLNEAINVEADKDGNWKTEVKTTNSKEPQTIKIIGNTSDIALENVLFGEVWVCSGQSNMQQPVMGYNGQPTFGSTMATAKSNNPNLRLFTVDRVGSKTPLKDVEKYTAWQQASPENVLGFSAVAYFFGQQLQEILDVPVGMIHTSWGGSIVEAWISKEVLSEYQEIDIEEADLANSSHVQTALYNAMINPLIPYSIKGALWYQGESNRKEPEDYKSLFPAMVKDWRAHWGIGDFPFYYVQIAPYLYGDNNAYETVDNSAFIREAQLQCLELIPNSGIAITMDIGDELCIHPPKKKEVADRLLFNALNQSYGYNTVDYAAPIYESQEVKDGEIILKFKNAETGLFSYGELEGFEISGDDKVFYPATATIANRMNVVVKSDRVPNPVAVRYAWKNWVVGTLYDTNLLPASSFRTDDWNDATLFKE